MKSKIKLILIAVGVIVLLSLAMIITTLVKKYTPSKEQADLNAYFDIEEEQVGVILNEGITEYKAIIEGGHVYLDINIIKDRINDRFYWDSNENILLYTTATDVVRVEANTSDYYVGNNKQAGDFGEIVKTQPNLTYVNLDFVKQYSNMTYSTYEDPSRVVIRTNFEPKQIAEVRKDTQIRVKGGIKSDILVSVEKGNKVVALDETGDWTHVVTNDGIKGYIKTKYLEDQIKEEVVYIPIVEEYKHVYSDDAICMAWHQSLNSTANANISEIIPQLKGVNVISPTWFSLTDNNGNISNNSSTSYVNFCHQNDIQVWGLVSNLENSDADTTEVISRTSTRTTLVNNIVAAAIACNMDGVNLDFESIDPAAGEGYIQLIRELALKCHNNDLVLSVDNYVPTDYTAFYNRAEQAVFADYVVIMAYDEHYIGSDAGSVSSISFVTKGVEDTLAQVPAKQTVLGLPFYTRMWQVEVTDEDIPRLDKVVTSQALGMSNARQMASVNGAEASWDSYTGQNYVQYLNSGSAYLIWFEDAESLALKMQLVKDNDLAGVSFWKLGFEDDSIWDTVIKYVN